MREENSTGKRGQGRLAKGRDCIRKFRSELPRPVAKTRGQKTTIGVSTKRENYNEVILDRQQAQKRAISPRSTRKSNDSDREKMFY